MRTTLATGSCGAVGILAVLRTSLYYQGIDKLAFSITLLMAFMFCVAIVELLWVARRTGALRLELDAIPSDAEYERVEHASPLLRSLLSARLDRTSLPVPGPVFAPFILSLLIMLGLLGTFLGLFETLRGAGLALDASADVEALRAGLKGPISGLMRSFGTSAAGVASSSMLGMAAVFVRRDSNRFGVALHEMASGRLARFAPARRQLLALETLAEQGRAWPTAAAALQQAVVELQTLQTSWVEAHSHAAEQTREQLGEATRTIRDVITSGVQHAAKSSSETIKPLLREAIADSGAAVREHLGALREQLNHEAEARKLHQSKLQELAEQQLQQLTARLQADTAARTQHEAAVRTQTTEHLQTLHQKLDTDAGARREHETLVRAQVAEHLQALYARVESEAQARRQHDEAVRAQLATQLQTLEAGFAHSRSTLSALETQRMQALLDGETARARSLAEQWQELARSRAAADAGLLSQFEQALAQATAQHGKRSETLAERFEQLAERVQAAFEQAGERDRERAAALSEVGARMQRDLAEAASVVRERLQDSAQAEATQQARAEELFARLGEASKIIAEAAQTQVGALGQFVAATDGRLREAEQRSHERLGDVLAQWSALGKEQAERIAGFEQALLGQHASTASDLGQRLAEHAAALQEKISRSAELLEQASTLIHGGGAELAAVAESFSSAVASQREGARQWLEALGDIERYALEAGEAAAADALGLHLARTHEVFDKQLQFQQELIAQLHGMRTREPAATTRHDASA
jgi:hypothetical protein